MYTLFHYHIKVIRQKIQTLSDTRHNVESALRRRILRYKIWPTQKSNVFRIEFHSMDKNIQTFIEMNSASRIVFVDLNNIWPTTINHILRKKRHVGSHPECSAFIKKDGTLVLNMVVDCRKRFCHAIWVFSAENNATD